MLGLVFATSVGTPVGARNLVRDFKRRLEEAELVPAEAMDRMLFDGNRDGNAERIRQTH